MKLYAPTPDGTKEMLDDLNDEPSEETQLKVALESDIYRLVEIIGLEATKELIDETLEKEQKKRKSQFKNIK